MGRNIWISTSAIALLWSGAAHAQQAGPPVVPAQDPEVSELGEVVVTVDGEQRVVTAPACLNIPAGKEHHILALTNCTWFCIWNEAIAEASALATKGD